MNFEEHKDLLLLLAGMPERFKMENQPETINEGGFVREFLYKDDYCDIEIQTPLTRFSLFYRLNDDIYELENIYS